MGRKGWADSGRQRDPLIQFQNAGRKRNGAMGPASRSSSRRPLPGFSPAGHTKIYESLEMYWYRSQVFRFLINQLAVQDLDVCACWLKRGACITGTSASHRIASQSPSASPESTGSACLRDTRQTSMCAYWPPPSLLLHVRVRSMESGVPRLIPLTTDRFMRIPL